MDSKMHGLSVLRDGQRRPSGPLSRLPAELRLRIYKYALDSPTPPFAWCRIPDGNSWEGYDLPPLFFVAASVVHEAAEAWFSSQSFLCPELESPFTQLLTYFDAFTFVHTVIFRIGNIGLSLNQAEVLAMMPRIRTLILRVDEQWKVSFDRESKKRMVSPLTVEHRQLYQPGDELGIALNVNTRRSFHELRHLIFDAQLNEYKWSDRNFWASREGRSLDALLHRLSIAAKNSGLTLQVIGGYFTEENFSAVHYPTDKEIWLKTRRFYR